MSEYNGIIIMDKPTGCSSHRCVSIARRALNMRKIGHTGTLDPAASGVLPLLIGNATRAADFLTLDNKRYSATVLLGTVTDTYDMDGQILRKNSVDVSVGELTAAVKSFVGETEQLPPMYSAISVGGQRLYNLARQGIEVERKKRKITIYSIDIVSINLPEVVLDVHCSKGTYIRSLAYDIGEKLKCGGCIKALRRTLSGTFDIKDAISPEKLIRLSENGNAESVIIPTDSVFANFSRIDLDKKTAQRVKNGVPVYYKAQMGVTYRVYDENGCFIALSRGDEEDKKSCLRLVKGFYG